LKCCTHKKVSRISSISDIFDPDREVLSSVYDSDITPVERQNRLIRRLGSDYPLYTEAANAYQEKNADLCVNSDGYYIAYCDTKKIDTLKVSLPYGDSEYKKLKNPYIINVGYLNAGDTIYVSSNNEADLHMKLYRMDEDVYNEVIGRLGRDTLIISEDGYKGGRIRGTVSASDDGYLILSIPYDTGFYVYVDGVRTEQKLAYEMMTAVKLTTGQHSIELRYHPQGLIPGIIVSLLSIAAFVLICRFYVRRLSDNA